MGRRIDKKFSESRRVTGLFPRGPIEFDLIWSGLPAIHCEDGYDELAFDIRPYPYMETPTNRGMLEIKALRHSQFMFCVTGWEGLEDDDGKPLPCTPENKEWLFNYDPQVKLFVLETIDELERINAVALKNS